MRVHRAAVRYKVVGVRDTSQHERGEVACQAKSVQRTGHRGRRLVVKMIRREKHDETGRLGRKPGADNGTPVSIDGTWTPKSRRALQICKMSMVYNESSLAWLCSMLSILPPSSALKRLANPDNAATRCSGIPEWLSVTGDARGGCAELTK